MRSGTQLRVRGSSSHWRTTDAGRVHIGRLTSYTGIEGDYGLYVRSRDGTTLIDGDKLTLTKSTGRLPSGVELGIAQTKVSASGLVANDGTRDRVIVGNIGASYGLKVVNPSGSTIIDGSSDMYRIIDTFTLSIAGVANNTNASTNSVRTGLGTFATLPAHLAYVTDTAGAFRVLGTYILYAVAAPPSQVLIWIRPSIDFSGSNVRAWLEVGNYRGVTIDVSCRFYILEQVAI